MNVNFHHDHGTASDCQLFVALTGSKDAILQELKKLISEFDTPYGKPCQGTMLQYQCTKSVVTPIWNGKEY